MPNIPARSRGFALLIVLWMLVLIAFVVAQMTAAGRTESRIAGNLAANSRSQAAADGAIYEAIFHVSDARPEQHWPVDGSEHAVQIGQSRIVLRLEDEAGRINPNLASGSLLEGLLRAVGSPPETAGDLAQAITEWVGSAKRPVEELLAEYQAAGLDYGPPGAPLESLDELSRVRGMTGALFRALQPHLTLFGPADPNAAAADPVVAAALVLSGALSAAGVAAPPPADPNAASDNVIARIHAAAEGPGNARVRRMAIVRIGGREPAGYRPLAWGNDDD
jgi:general secretion pathway protein K